MKTITQTQVLAVAEILQLNPARMTDLTITVDEVEVTYIDPEASKNGPIVHEVHTYQIDKTRKEA